jgi:hypothetical protein
MDLQVHGETRIKSADATFAPGPRQAWQVESYLDRMLDLGLEPVRTEYNSDGWIHIYVASE